MTFLFLLLLISLLEWMMPSTNFRPFLMLFLGMVLLLILLQPVFSFFTMEPKKWIEKELEQFFSNEPLDSSYENKKREIQASIDAYILEETKQQMKDEVKEELKVKYGLEIDSLTIVETKDSEMVVTVVLQQITIDRVDPISIGPNKEKKKEVKNDELSLFLCEKWGLTQEQLNIEVKKK